MGLEGGVSYFGVELPIPFYIPFVHLPFLPLAFCLFLKKTRFPPSLPFPSPSHSQLQTEMDNQRTDENCGEAEENSNGEKRLQAEALWLQRARSGPLFDQVLLPPPSCSLILFGSSNPSWSTAAAD